MGLKINITYLGFCEDTVQWIGFPWRGGQLFTFTQQFKVTKEALILLLSRIAFLIYCAGYLKNKRAT